MQTGHSGGAGASSTDRTPKQFEVLVLGNDEALVVFFLWPRITTSDQVFNRMDKDRQRMDFVTPYHRRGLWTSLYSSVRGFAVRRGGWRNHRVVQLSPLVLLRGAGYPPSDE